MMYFTLSGILRYLGEGGIVTHSMAILRQRLGQIQPKGVFLRSDTQFAKPKVNLYLAMHA